MGLGKPLTEGRIGIMFGHEGRGLLEDALPRIRTESDLDASPRVDAPARPIESAGADVLVAIGPLSNVGVLLRAGVRLPRLSISLATAATSDRGKLGFEFAGAAATRTIPNTSPRER